MQQIKHYITDCILPSFNAQPDLAYKLLNPKGDIFDALDASIYSIGSNTMLQDGQTVKCQDISDQIQSNEDNITKGISSHIIKKHS